MLKREIKVRKSKGSPAVKVTVEVPSTIAEMKRRFNLDEAGVVAKAVQSLVIDFQGYVRRQDGGKWTPEWVRSLWEKWVPGARTVSVVPAEVLIKEAHGLTRENAVAVKSDPDNANARVFWVPLQGEKEEITLDDVQSEEEGEENGEEDSTPAAAQRSRLTAKGRR